MRNWKNIDSHYMALLQDIYPQPPDDGHTKMFENTFNKWGKNCGIKCVIDMGCGDTEFARPYFEGIGVQYTPINIQTIDMNFPPFEDETFDCVFSRHSLEHSPMPLLTLMEWNRISNHLLWLILPNPEHFGYAGLNHYSVMPAQQIEFLLDRAGWRVVWTDFSENQELRYMCEKKTSSRYEQFMLGEE